MRLVAQWEVLAIAILELSSSYVTKKKGGRRKFYFEKSSLFMLGGEADFAVKDWRKYSFL